MRMVHRAAFLAAVLLLAAAPASAQRDDMLCYKVKPTLFQPKLDRGQSVRVEDVLDPNNVLGLDPNDVPGERSTFGIKKVREVCLASQTDGGGLVDPDTHWVWYELKPAKGGCTNDPAIPCKEDDDCAMVGGACEPQPKFNRPLERNRSVRVVDEFNDVRVDMDREVAILAPATVNPASGGAFLGLPPDNEGYKCYGVKPTKLACVGGGNAGAVCGEDADCAGGSCAAQLKFPNDTHPDGLETDVENFLTGVFDAPDPDRPFAVRKLKAYCQATDRKFVGAPATDRAEAQAGMLCYAVKALKFSCSGGDNDNHDCRDNDDCPGGGICRAEPKYDNRAPQALGFYVEDELFEHRFDLLKEDLLCVPACKEPPAQASFSPHVLRMNSVQMPTFGHAFSPVASLINSPLASTVSSGSINLLLELDRFGDGAMEINSYTGSLAPANAGCNVNDGAQQCTYLVDPGSIDPNSFRTRTTCSNSGIIVIPSEIEGTDSEPLATLNGGDEDTGFRFSVPFTNTVTIDLNISNVRVSGDLVHSGGGFTALNNGRLTGVVLSRDFKQTARELPPGLCQGAGNDNEPCQLSNDLCPGGGECNPLLGTCAGGTRSGLGCGDDSACPNPGTGDPSDRCNETYIGGFTTLQVAGFVDLISRDVDLDGELSCEGATNGGEPCVTLDDCPDQQSELGAFCDQNEGSSLILDLGGIDALIGGVQP